MKYLFTFSFAIFTFYFNYCQVGIGTLSPDPSAALDISASDKGVKFPSYVLTTLNDPTNPIMNPKEGLIIYNSGGNYPQSYYVWFNNHWSNLITPNEVNRAMFINIPTYIIGTTEYFYLNQVTTNNALTNMTVIGANNNDMSLNTDNSTISLPAGKFKISVAGDLRRIVEINNGTPTINGLNGRSYYYRSYNTYIKSSSGDMLSPPASQGKLWSQYFSSYGWDHYIELSQPTDIKVYWDTDSDSNICELNPRSGITITIYELK